MTKITVKYSLSPEEFAHMHVEVCKCTSKCFRYQQWIIVVIVVSIAATWFISSWFSWELCALGIFLISFRQGTWWAAKRRARRLPDTNKVITWEFSDSEIRNSTEGSEARFAWDRIIKVHESEKWFLLFPQPLFAYGIPKHGFQNVREIELFREIVGSNVPKFTSEPSYSF